MCTCIGMRGVPVQAHDVYLHRHARDVYLHRHAVCTCIRCVVVRLGLPLSLCSVSVFRCYNFHPYTCVSQSLYLCPRLFVSPFLCVPVSMCLHLYVSPYLCVPVSMCSRVYVPLCLCVPVSVCPHIYALSFLPVACLHISLSSPFFFFFLFSFH